MTDAEILQEFRQAGALLEGHFILSSGLHSGAYVQCARVLQDASRAGRLCAVLADRLNREVGGEIELVVSPALGGIVVGYEMGRQLQIPSCFFERADGRFTLRRGFEIAEGTPCLMMEDVVTTGLSTRECVAAARAEGANVVAAGCLIDRSGGKADIGVPLVALTFLDIPAYPPDALPDELQSIPAVKPGSRGLQ
jgi:orotate phosphoribosyltransferase